MTAKAIISSAAGAESKLYVDDVFSTYIYTGNGSTQTITDGIDRTQGALDIFKGRSAATDWAWYDTVRGVQKDLASNTTAAQTTQAQGVTAVSSTGVTIGSLAKINTNAATYVKATFRKAPKFFDVVTYTGNGVSDTAIAHALGGVPGMVVTKRTDSTSNWQVQHRSLVGSGNPSLLLNSNDAASSNEFGATSPTATHFYVGSNNNVSGATYVAYLFAHDPSADGIIQAGSYTGNGSTTGPIVTLGWEPQYLLVKNAGGLGSWYIQDSMRGSNVGDTSKVLLADVLNSEAANQPYWYPSSTGFTVEDDNASCNSSGVKYIYLAIRRPNKPPTSGTQVYKSVAYTGNATLRDIDTSPVTPDFVIVKSRASGHNFTSTRLVGSQQYMATSTTTAEATGGGSWIYMDVMNAFRISYSSGIANASGTSYISHAFRRAPGFFDVVCYTGTGSATTVAHGLGVVPELVIYKPRESTALDDAWTVWHTDFSTTHHAFLNTTAAKTTSSNSMYTNNSAPTVAAFPVGLWTGGAFKYVAYLFATLPGISKVGSYTGNGTSQTIDCGFAAGARFVLIKRADSTGDWYVWDTARGIVAANDPALRLNTNSAETTIDDSIDPANAGFVVNQNINVNGGQYIYLAIA